MARMTSLAERVYLEARFRLLGVGKTYTASLWDREFASGKWESMDGEIHSVRQTVLAALVARYAPPGRKILEVGCGTAMLARHLPAERARDYVGLDVSAVALELACSRAPAAAQFVQASAEPVPREALQSLAPFGVIVFNEVLFYFRDPVETILSYRELLAPDGYLVLSIWNTRRSYVMRRRVLQRLAVASLVTVGPRLPSDIIVASFPTK